MRGPRRQFFEYLTPLIVAESLIGTGNARQQRAHMLPGLPRAGTIRGLNTISPGLLCPGKVTSFGQDRAQHLIGGRIIRVETHDVAQDSAASAQFSSLNCSLARPYQIMAFSGCSASIAVKISILVWTISLCTQSGSQLLPSLSNPLSHLSPNRSLANPAALYPFNGLSDLHRYFKLAITLGLPECGQSAFVS